MKKIVYALSLIIALSFTSCAMKKSTDNFNSYIPTYNAQPGESGNTYTEITEHDFVDTLEANTSNISLSINTSSYADIRNQLYLGKNVSKDAVKIEEMINYFHYDYETPQSSDPLAFSSVVLDTPWNNQTKLLLVGMQAEAIEKDEQKPNNLVFLIDVSGSMYGADRLELIKQSFILMVENLNDNDTISIVTYAGSQRVILDGGKGNDKMNIIKSLENLTAGGSTAGGAAISKAYEIAKKYQTQDNNSSIIIATDGDFNVGYSNSTQLKELIINESRNGINLSVIGVGYGNLRNDLLESIALAGNGRHIYMSSLFDAQKFLVEELGAIINTVALDSKAQIEFNKDVVSQFRLIGYENRQLSLDEYEDSETKAGVIGSGTQITACYEIKLHDVEGDIANVELRYKNPEELLNQEQHFTITSDYLNPSTYDNNSYIKTNDTLFIVSVIEFGLILRDSKYKGSASYNNIQNRLALLDVEDDIYKKDFKLLINYLTK